jgi:hypothetical protein
LLGDLGDGDQQADGTVSMWRMARRREMATYTTGTTMTTMTTTASRYAHQNLAQ